MPAIGFPHFSWHSRNDSLEVQSVPMFDAMITAFHSDIWKFVFPYESRWDNQVWWWFRKFFVVLDHSALKFHQLQYHTPISAFVYFARRTLTVCSLGTGL
jgi:hypothetical protein